MFADLCGNLWDLVQDRLIHRRLAARPGRRARPYNSLGVTCALAAP